MAMKNALDGPQSAQPRSAASPQKFPIKSYGGNNKSNSRNDLPDSLLRYALGIVCAQKITCDGSNRHESRCGPVDQPGEDEHDGRDQVYQRAENRFQRVHLMNVAQPHEPQRREHQNADARAEITAVNSHAE